MSTLIRKTIDDNSVNLRLDRWLREHIPGLQQSYIEKMLRKGEIRVDGQKALSNLRVSQGQTVTFPEKLLNTDEIKPEPKKQQLSKADEKWLKSLIIYEDEDLFVLNKPSGLAVQGGTKITKSLDKMLLLLFPEKKPRLVHRIDKDTSGILIVARHLKAAQFLTKSFFTKNVEKTYWALVQGVPSSDEGKIDLPLTKGMIGEAEKIYVDHEEGLKAITHYRLIENLGKKMAWLELMPHTGRTHQLRVHCASGLRTPIIGDGKYGGIDVFPFGRTPMHLHARSLTFTTPKGKRLTVTADLPVHMQETWEKLGLNVVSHTR